MSLPEKHIDDYTFFYKGRLSQWYGGFKGQESSFNYNNITFNCAEQFMMYSKACLFKDTVSAQSILQTSNPREQQLLGRKVDNFDQSIWNTSKFDLVLLGNILKFSQNPPLLSFLLSCRNNFVEASPIDGIWGIKIGIDKISAIHTNPSTWRGDNLLGLALTKTKLLLQP